MTEEQKLVDIVYAIGITIATHESFHIMSPEEVGEWVRKQLHMSGFHTIPMGASWGMLTTEEAYIQYENYKQ